MRTQALCHANVATQIPEMALAMAVKAPACPSASMTSAIAATLSATKPARSQKPKAKKARGAGPRRTGVKPVFK